MDRRVSVEHVEGALELGDLFQRLELPYPDHLAVAAGKLLAIRRILGPREERQLQPGLLDGPLHDARHLIHEHPDSQRLRWKRGDDLLGLGEAH